MSVETVPALQGNLMLACKFVHANAYFSHRYGSAYNTQLAGATMQTNRGEKMGYI